MRIMKIFAYNIYLACCYSIGKVKHYRDGDSKSALRIFLELICWWVRTGEFNTMYYAMGLNLQNTSIGDFIGRREFLKLKDRVENHLKQKHGSPFLANDAVCKDKFVSAGFLKANGIPCSENLALINDDCIKYTKAAAQGIETVLNHEGKYILKHITMEAGAGVHILEVKDGKLLINQQPTNINELKNILKNGIWVLQNFLQSHEDIRKINSSALNTTRIVTCLNGGKPEYLAGFQSFAVNGEDTDSWSKGSVYVGIDIERECLRELGFYDLSVKDKSIATEHPDSGILFKDYHLPYLKDAVELCKKAHELLYFNFIIGWDVAITEGGPVIIEANEKPGMNAVQCLDGGLKGQILKAAESNLHTK